MDRKEHAERRIPVPLYPVHLGELFNIDPDSIRIDFSSDTFGHNLSDYAGVGGKVTLTLDPFAMAAIQIG